MKISKLIYKIILIGMLLIMFNSHTCYAAKKPGVSEEHLDDGDTGAVVYGDDDLLLPDINSNYYKPSVELGGNSKEIIEQVLGVLTVLGVITIVISIALIGFGSILGSAQEKASNQAKYVGILIAAIFLTGGSAIAKMIIEIAESI